MANVFQLFGQIFIDNSKANESIDNTTKKAENAGSKVGSAFSSIVKGAAAVGTAVVGAASALGAAAYSMVSKTATQADTIDKLSERTSINREELQRWMHACDRSGVSSDVLQAAVKKMSSTLDSAAQGSSSAANSLSRLGLTLNDLEGMTTEEKFSKITAALADMEDSTERNALGAALLGKGYTEMLPLLNAGSEGIAALKNEADELGIVMSEDAVKAGVTFGDTVLNIKAAFGGFMNTLANSLMPMAQSLADFIIDALPAIREMFENLAPVVQSAFSNILTPLFELVKKIFPALISLVDTLLPILSEIINEILPVLLDLADELLPLLLTLIKTVLPVIVSLMKLIAPVLKLIAPLLAPILEMLIAILDPLVKLLDLILPPIINILTDLIENKLVTAQAVFETVAGVISGVFGGAFEYIGTIFENVKNVFQNIIDFIKNVFTGNWKGAWENVKNIFKSIWDSFKTIVKAPINYIIKAINGLIGGINKISFDVPDWVPGIGGKTLGFDIPSIPELRRGLEYVPRDDYPALLHKGEQVLTASEKKEYDQVKAEEKDERKKERKIEIHLSVNVENFNNYSDEDIDGLSEKLMYILSDKIRRDEEVFA